MTRGELLEVLRADLQRHLPKPYSRLRALRVVCETQGLWATVVYRVGQYVYANQGSLLAPAAKLAYRGVQKLVEVVTGISVPASARIGKGFYIGHFGAIIVHPETVAGERFSIGQGVTIGTRGLGTGGVPRFGDNVYVGVGAKVLGSIIVGDNAAIGANAVVIRDVPAGSTAVGVPARTLDSSEPAAQWEALRAEQKPTDGEEAQSTPLDARPGPH